MRARAFILVLCAGPAAMAQEPKGISRVLLDRSLQEHAVRITGLDAGAISYLEGALLRSEAVSEYLAILPGPEEPAAAPPRPARPAPAEESQSRWRGRGQIPFPQFVAPEPRVAPAAPPVPWLQLVDGQIFKGRLAESTDGKDTIAWSNPAVGAIELKIDHVHRIYLRDAAAGAELTPAAANDVIVFVNADRLEGFIETVADPLVITVGEQQREVPLDRIAQVIFANPLQPRSGTYVWLADGSVVAARQLRTTRVGELHLIPRLSVESESAPPPGAASMGLDQLRAVNFDAAKLLPLSALAPEGQEPIGERRWTQPASAVSGEFPLDAADVLIPGPMRVYWALPAHVTRLATTAELPRESWTWGNCQVVVSLQSQGTQRELLRQNLSAEQPAAAVNVELGSGEGRRLVISIEPGEDGPVQDRAILRRPLLAVDSQRQ